MKCINANKLHRKSGAPSLSCRCSEENQSNLHGSPRIFERWRIQLSRRLRPKSIRRERDETIGINEHALTNDLYELPRRQ
jgi:hypothetical protein